MSDFEEVKAVVRLNPDGSMTRVERTPHGHGGAGKPSTDPMTLLLMAYRIMVNSPDCKPLLDPLMDLIKQKERIMTQVNTHTEGY